MSGRIDFLSLLQRFHSLGKGVEAELKHVSKPAELEEYPSAYRLFPGLRLNEGMLRVAYCLPWAKHEEGAARLGAQFAAARISEQRMFQVFRGSHPNDIVQFRRLLQHAKPTADWRYLGPLLLRWSRQDKRRLLEEYYLRASGEQLSV